MKIEFYADTARTASALAEFLPKWAAACKADRAEWSVPIPADVTIGGAVLGFTDNIAGETECEPASVNPNAKYAPKNPETGETRARRTGRRYLLPAFGVVRRTKAELSEDAELAELGAALGKSKDAMTSEPVVYLLPAWREEASATGPAQISTSPEDRTDPAQEVDDAVDGEIVDEIEVTAEMLKSAMTKVAETRGMPWLVENMTALTGAAKFSLIDAANYGPSYEALTEAAAEADVNG